MMNFTKKTGIAVLLLLCTAMFLSAWERSFDIPGKGTLEREVEVERVDEYDKNGRLVTSYYAGNIINTTEKAGSSSFQIRMVTKKTMNMTKKAT